MNHQEILFSPTATFSIFLMSVWPWILLERKSYCRWILSTSSIQCHVNTVLVPPLKPPDPVKYLYDSNTYDFKTRLDICTRMDVDTVEYVTFSHKFHLMM